MDGEEKIGDPIGSVSESAPETAQDIVESVKEPKGDGFFKKFSDGCKKQPWLVVSIVLALALIYSLSSGSGVTGSAISEVKAGDSIVSYLNENVGGGVSLVGVEDQGNLYRVNVDYNGQQVPVYVTKDGNYLVSDVQELPNSKNSGSGGTPTVGNPTTNTIDIDDDPIKGDPNAPVTIVEFSDYECPFCARFYTDTLPQIESEYIDKGLVKLVYRDFPLSIHPNAQKAGEAAECAGEQGGDDKYFEYHDKLFDNQRALGNSDLKKYAGELGLNQGEFDNCLDSGEMASEVKNDFTSGSSLGVTGTPGFFVNGVELKGAQPFSEFKRVIDVALAGDGGSAQPPSQTPPVQPIANINEDDDAVKGDPNAPVTIVEFSDYECPFCGKYYKETLPQIQKNYVDTGKVKIVYRDFPLSFHPNAQKAAEAAECAGDQGGDDKYWEMHDVLFDNQQALGVASLKQYAGNLGLNQGEFDNCLDSGKFTTEVKKDMAEGQSYGVSGTPGFFINGQQLVGAQPYSEFKRVIDAELAK